MKKIRIMLDFMAGPIWCEYLDPVSFEPKTNIDIIDNDDKLQKINKDIQELYTGYYEFDSHEQPCWFNEEQEKKDKDKMLDLLKELNERLNELNDGSFEIEDLETQRIMKL